MSKHVQWELFIGDANSMNYTYGIHVKDGDDEWVIADLCEDIPVHIKKLAIWRILVCAPRLLNALTTLVHEQWRDYDDMPRIAALTEAKSAIAEATGETS